jgi:hypothetical protein
MPNEFLRAEWFCEGRGYCHPLCGRHEFLSGIKSQIWGLGELAIISKKSSRKKSWQSGLESLQRGKRRPP